MKTKLKMIPGPYRVVEEILAQRSPWDDYDHPGNGKGKPIVPEAQAYGAVFLGLMIIFLALRSRWVKK